MAQRFIHSHFEYRLHLSMDTDHPLADIALQQCVGAKELDDLFEVPCILFPHRAMSIEGDQSLLEKIFRDRLGIQKGTESEYINGNRLPLLQEFNGDAGFTKAQGED